MPNFPTLIKPPPASTNKAPIEDVLELTHVEDIDPNLFTNTRPLWHPPGARGVYGGAVIAQCLVAAQRTVPEDFTVHSMHCYFVLNGNAEIPVIYDVEHVREGRSFATRTVQARQRGQPIFTTTLSFMREGSGGKQTVEHAATMRDVPGPAPEGTAELKEMDKSSREGRSPFVSQRIAIANADSPHPHEKRTLQWLKARGRISEEGGHQAHTSALAYMSDSYFIGTVSRTHRLGRRGMSEEEKKDLGLATSDEARPQIGMMVSLDHSIYFHNPRAFRADEWMFTEMETPWAGSGRGLVFQRIFTKDGLLIASCVQEGVVRLVQDKPKL